MTNPVYVVSKDGEPLTYYRRMGSPCPRCPNGSVVPDTVLDGEPPRQLCLSCGYSYEGGVGRPLRFREHEVNPLNTRGVRASKRPWALQGSSPYMASGIVFPKRGQQ